MSDRNPAGWPEDISSVIRSVAGDYGITLTFDDGWSYLILTRYLMGDINIGDEVVRYGGIGYPVQGIVVNGQVLFYKTREQADMEHAQFVAHYNRKYGNNG